MLSKENNELVTRTGPGTACGSLMRGYWQPAALTEELDGDRPVKAVRLMGEDLVLFRDEAGEYALIGRRCPHRGADLCYGRLEDGGLRCTFHGWLFDSAGRCLEQPAEPPGSRFREKIRHVAYQKKKMLKSTCTTFLTRHTFLRLSQYNGICVSVAKQRRSRS